MYMGYIKTSAKTNAAINILYKPLRYWNGVGYWKMSYAKNENRKKEENKTI